MHPRIHFMAMANRWALRTFYCHIVIIIIIIIVVVIVVIVGGLGWILIFYAKSI